VGGYTAAMLSSELHLTPWLGMLVGGALAAVLGAVIGYLGFRFGLRGFYFVLLTVAFAEVCRILVSNIDALGGAIGLYITFTGDPRQFQFQDARAYYYIALALMLLATGVVALLGPLLGSFILTPLGELSRLSLGHGGYHGLHLVAYGVLLVAVVLFLPQGAYPYLARVLRRRDA